MHEILLKLFDRMLEVLTLRDPVRVALATTLGTFVYTVCHTLEVLGGSTIVFICCVCGSVLAFFLPGFFGGKIENAEEKEILDSINRMIEAGKISKERGEDLLVEYLQKKINRL